MIEPPMTRSDLRITRTLIVMTVTFVVGIVWLAWWAINDRNNYETACADQGGIVVRSHYGEDVCIDRDTMIEVP